MQAGHRTYRILVTSWIGSRNPGRTFQGISHRTRSWVQATEFHAWFCTMSFSPSGILPVLVFAEQQIHIYIQIYGYRSAWQVWSLHLCRPYTTDLGMSEALTQLSFQLLRCLSLDILHFILTATAWEQTLQQSHRLPRPSGHEWLSKSKLAVVV